MEVPGKLRPQIRRRMKAAGFHKEAEMAELVSVVEGIIKEGWRQKDIIICAKPHELICMHYRQGRQAEKGAVHD